MSGHTPGPWIADGSSVKTLIRQRMRVLVTTVQVDFAERDENLRNAKLIAAAPELWSALMFLADSASIVAGQSSMGHLLTSDIARARLALAKAHS